MKATYLHAAKAEFEEAIQYYNDQRAGLGFGILRRSQTSHSAHQELSTRLDTTLEAHSTLPDTSISLQHHLRSTS
jgi:hypothetical protein